MYKVRSMCLDAEQRLKELLEKNQHQEGVTFKLKDDPRITKVGKWLRKFLSMNCRNSSMYSSATCRSWDLGHQFLVKSPNIHSAHRRGSQSNRHHLHLQISGRSEIDFSGQVPARC